MIATIKETYKSLTDFSYGKEIIKKSKSQAFWYWFKYVLTVSIITLFLVIAGISYFTPQFPKLAADKLPQFDLTVKKGIATSKMIQPQKYVDSGMAFIFDLTGKLSDLDAYKNGVVILSDKIVVKTTDSSNVVSTKELKWTDTGDFSVDKNVVVSWLTDNKIKILSGLLVASVVLGALYLFFYTSGQIFSMIIWSLLFMIVAKVLKKNLDFSKIFSLVAYGSVISFLLGLVNLFVSIPFLFYPIMAIFVLYVCVWMYKLE